MGSGLGCEHGWISVDDAVRPRVLLVSADADGLEHLLQVARRLARRARVEVAVPNRGPADAQVVYAVGGVTVHRFMWATGLAMWLIAYAGRYEAVHLHGGSRRSLPSLVLRNHPRLVRTSAEDVADGWDEIALRVFTQGVGLPA